MDSTQLLIQTAIKAWELQIERTDRFLNGLTDESSFAREIAPGRNRVIYLLGHLIAVNDNIHRMFGKTERSYAHLDEAFHDKPDRSGLPLPEPSELMEAWRRSNEQLASLFASMSVDDWLTKHTAITDEDYAKQPTRNKVAVLMNRTSHVAYHLGQLMLTA